MSEQRGHSESMSSQEPDDEAGPEPERTPGLEPGGSVPPGETPPEAASATRGVSHTQKAAARPTKWIWLAALVLVLLLIAAPLVALSVGWIP